MRFSQAPLLLRFLIVVVTAAVLVGLWQLLHAIAVNQSPAVNFGVAGLVIAAATGAWAFDRRRSLRKLRRDRDIGGSEDGG